MKLTSQRRYGTSRASAASIAGGKLTNFTRCSCCRLVQRPTPTRLDRSLAHWVSARHVIPYIRSTQRHSHTCFCEESTGSFAACYEVSRRSPVTVACASTAASLSQGMGACVSSAAPSATEARASGAAPLNSGIIQATGACASDAAPLSLGTGACAPSAAPPSHAQRSSQTAAPARRSF